MTDRTNAPGTAPTEAGPGPDMGLHVDRRWSGSALVLHPVGSVDALSAPVLLDAILAGAGCAPLVVVDLADVDFLDCAGLGALVAGHGRARTGGCRVRVAAPRAPVRLLLTVFGLDATLGGGSSVDAECDHPTGDLTPAVPTTPPGPAGPPPRAASGCGPG
ncbi:STAS domain-containing protein [Kineococcus gynurae]|uniref:STAS domain-containing protein n=1 Tax=Kineococcus gynurae TaxID=452979 RepID=A0ABV5LV49_9ACTN